MRRLSLSLDAVVLGELAVVPDEGGDEVVPPDGRVARRVAHARPRGARALLPARRDSGEQLKRRDEGVHAVLPDHERVQEVRQQSPDRVREGRVGGLAVNLREDEAQRPQRGLPERVLLLLERDDARALLLRPAAALVVAGVPPAVRVVVVAAVRASVARRAVVPVVVVLVVEPGAAARGVVTRARRSRRVRRLRATPRLRLRLRVHRPLEHREPLLALHLRPRHRNLHRGEGLAEGGALEHRADRAEGDGVREVEVAPTRRVVVVLERNRLKRRPKRRQRAAVRSGNHRSLAPLANGLGSSDPAAAVPDLRVERGERARQPRRLDDPPRREPRRQILATSVALAVRRIKRRTAQTAA